MGHTGIEWGRLILLSVLKQSPCSSVHVNHLLSLERKSHAFKHLVTQFFGVKYILVSKTKSLRIAGIVSYLEMVATKNHLKER